MYRQIMTKLPLIMALFPLLGSAPWSDAGSNAKFGSWEVTSSKDAMNDAVRAEASTTNGKDSLIFQCVAGKGHADLAVQTEDYLGGRGGGWRVGTLVYRFDAAPPVTTFAHYDKHLMVFPDEKRLLAFFRPLADAKSVTFRLETFDYTTIDTQFDLAGAKEAVAEALKRCS